MWPEPPFQGTYKPEQKVQDWCNAKMGDAIDDIEYLHDKGEWKSGTPEWCGEVCRTEGLSRLDVTFAELCVLREVARRWRED